jgi:enterobactin synthetase component D
VIELSPHSPYAPAFRVDTAHGVIAGVHLPAAPDVIPEYVLAALHPDERAHATTCRAFRQVQFVGGRLAMGSLLRDRMRSDVPVLPDQHGAPVLPSGLTGSISHKRDLAVAIVTSGRHGLGIDIEETHKPGLDIASHVLCDDEQQSLAGLDAQQRWAELITRFSIKEALYKALHRFVLRFIDFREVAVWPDGEGSARIDLRFDHTGHYRFAVRYMHFERGVLTVVEAHEGPA